MLPIGDDNSSERTFPIVTFALIALNVLFFFVELSGGDAFVKQWAFVPRRFLANPPADLPTLFTSMFMPISLNDGSSIATMMMSFGGCGSRVAIAVNRS